jgi:hypothetical protein
MSHHPLTRAQHCYKNLLDRITDTAVQKLTKCRESLVRKLEFSLSIMLDPSPKEIKEVKAEFGELLLDSYMKVLNDKTDEAFRVEADCAVHSSKCLLPHADMNFGHGKLRFASGGTVCTDLTSFGSMLRFIV